MKLRPFVQQLVGEVAEQLEMSLEDCVRQKHPECSYQVTLCNISLYHKQIFSDQKGKVARGVFGDWRVAPFTSLKLARMK